MTNHPTQQSEDELDEALSEYFTWKGEAIWEVNRTENYKRLKEKLRSIGEASRLEAQIEVLTNLLDEHDVTCGAVTLSEPRDNCHLQDMLRDTLATLTKELSKLKEMKQ